MIIDTINRLWDYMIDNPMSSEELAKKIGITRPTLLSIAYDRVEPRHEVRCKIEKFLKEQEKSVE